MQASEISRIRRNFRIKSVYFIIPKARKCNAFKINGVIVYVKLQALIRYKEQQL